MTPDQAQELRRVASRRRRAEEEYRETLEALLASGVSYVALAQVLGVSRQAVRQFALRGSTLESGPFRNGMGA